MSYSDIQMIIASQIAYMDFNLAAVSSGSYTVMELLNIEIEGEEEGSERYKTINKLMERIENDCPSCGEWKIRDIRNNQSSSGMYACLLDTGDGDALVAFRGSESDNLNNIIKDWVQSDLGLLNSTLTPQQETAEKYLKDIYKKYGDEYDSFGLTGHSLGGNLAEHAAITAPDGMRDKITQCVNLDGPGFSAAYLNEHAEDIQKAKDCITHYQWSWCGRLLNRVPGGRYQTIQADTPNDKGCLLLNMGFRHDTYNVVRFDKNGNAIPGTPDWLALAVDPIAKSIDFGLFLITGGLALLIDNTVEVIKEMFQNMEELWGRIMESFASQAQFELQAAAMENELGELESYIPQLKGICNGVERIQKELAFDSIAAGYVKYKLWNIANSIERDASKLDVYCEKGRDCTHSYRLSEQKIVDNYG